MTSKPPRDTVPPCGCVRGEDGYWAVLCSEAERLWEEYRNASIETDRWPLRSKYVSHMREADKNSGLR